MQIILRDDMDNLGKSGEVVNVKPGYARNYLLPRGLAHQGNGGRHQARRAREARHRRPHRQAGQGRAVRGRQAVADVGFDRGAPSAKDDKPLRVGHHPRHRGGAEGAQGVIVDPKKIHLDEPIKALGLAEVPIKVGRGITATVKVWVVKKED